MSIWHKLVENLLVISAEEERKGYVEPSSPCLPAVPPSCSGGGLLLVPALGRPPEYKCSKAAVAGSLSVCLSVSGIMWQRGRACGESGSPRARSHRTPAGVAPAGMHWY